MPEPVSFLLGAIIVVLYASNFFSSFPAINAWRRAMPCPETRAQAIGYALASMVRPCLMNRQLADEARANMIYTIGPWVAYVSMGAALALGLSHLAWLVSGAWRHQPHLLEFAAGHYLAAIAIHLFHLLLVQSAPKGGDHASAGN